jgi:hypothetical protein
MFFTVIPYASSIPFIVIVTPAFDAKPEIISPAAKTSTRFKMSVSLESKEIALKIVFA